MFLNSKRISMDYVIVSDIFGLTPALTRFKMGVSSNSMLIDPYNGKLQVIESEDNHYEKFIVDGSLF